MSGFRKFLPRATSSTSRSRSSSARRSGALVTAFTASFITPLLAAIGGKPDFSAPYFTVNGSKFFYGRFINALIAFLILAAVIYLFVIVPMVRLLNRYKPTPEAMKDCPQCLSSIPVAASKCAFCASPQLQVPVQARRFPRTAPDPRSRSLSGARGCAATLVSPSALSGEQRRRASRPGREDAAGRPHHHRLQPGAPRSSPAGGLGCRPAAASSAGRPHRAPGGGVVRRAVATNATPWRMLSR